MRLNDSFSDLGPVLHHGPAGNPTLRSERAVPDLRAPLVREAGDMEGWGSLGTDCPAPVQVRSARFVPAPHGRVILTASDDRVTM